MSVITTRSEMRKVLFLTLSVCGFWVTICKLVRPMLSDHCPVQSVLSCLSHWCIVAKQLDGSR